MSSTQRHASWARHYDEVYRRCFGAAYDDLTQRTLSLVSELPGIRRIVEIGAGTGRLALPLATAGFSVTAVEPSRPMLAQLAAKDADNLIATQNASMANFSLSEPYDLAIAVFTVISYILTPSQLRASFSTVSTALHVGGFFLIDVPNEGLFQDTDVEADGISRRLRFVPTTRSRYQYTEQTRVETSTGVVHFEDRCELRLWRHQQVLDALHDCGLEWYRDVSPQFPHSGASYWVLRKGRHALRSATR